MRIRDVVVVHRQVLSGSNLDLPQRCEMLGEHRADPAADADQPDGGDVALEQAVGGLGRAVSEEDDVLGSAAHALEQLVQRGDDAVGDPIGMVMAGRGLDLTEQLERRGVDGDGIGEGAADVDADPQRRSVVLGVVHGPGSLLLRGRGSGLDPDEE